MPNDAVPVDPATLSLDLSTESATTALFRAAIGPVGANHYLPVFARFDVADRAGSGWNWAACLCTLGWMAFRRLWGAALMYAAVMVGVGLLAAALLGLVFEVPKQVQWGLGLALLLAAYVVPGAWGDAWLYDHCRKRMAGALAQSSSWSEAAALLEREALRPSRAWWLVLAHLAGLGAIAGVVGTLPGLQLPAPAKVPGAVAPRGPQPSASTPAPAGHAAVGAASAGVAAAVASPASAPASAPTATGLAAPASAAASASATMRVPGASSGTATVPASVSSPASAVSPAVPESRAALRVAPPATAASAPSVPASMAPAPRSPASGATRAPVPVASTPIPVPAAGPAPASAGESGGRYIINVGLFALDANARRAEAALRGAGVPLLVQELQTSAGKRTRVRAGPYPSQAQAEAAADTVRALGLEAQVVRQPAPAGR